MKPIWSSIFASLYLLGVAGITAAAGLGISKADVATARAAGRAQMIECSYRLAQKLKR